MNPLKFHLLFFTFLFSYHLLNAQEGIEKKSCDWPLRYYKTTHQEKAGRELYLERMKKAVKGFNKTNEDWKKSAYSISIAYCHYCLDSDIDSVNYYLKQSFLIDDGLNISRLIQNTQYLYRKPNPKFHLPSFLIEGADLFDYPYMEISKTFTFEEDKDPYKIPELETLKKKDQLYRDSIINRKDSIAKKQWALDSLIREDFVELYNKKEKAFSQDLSNKDRMAIFLIFIHAPYSFIEEHIEIVDTLSKHNNISLFEFVVDRYFCNKYGKTPIGRYCEKDKNLLPELKRMFPTYQIEK